MEWPVLVALALASSVVLAGCNAGELDADPRMAQASDSSAGTAHAGEGVGETMGAITGTVVDQTVTPIGNATIRIGVEHNTTTDDQGRFRLSSMAPGAHVLEATKAGYGSAQISGTVVAGKVADVKIVLTKLASTEPYTDVYKWDGLISCGIAWHEPVGGEEGTSCNGLARAIPGFPSSLDASGITILVGPLNDVVGFWGELSWTPTTEAANKMTIEWGYSVDAGRANFKNVMGGSGESPVVVRIPIDAYLESLGGTPSAFCTPEDCELYGVPRPESSLGADPIAVGAAFQQSFTAFLTVFHFGTLPEQYAGVTGG